MAETAPSVCVSVLIPNWNGGEKLVACVGSLRRELEAATGAAAAGAWEIVVVDDASPEGEADLAALRATFADEVAAGRLRLSRRATNGGFGATVNEAAREARGDFLLLANNDLLAQRDFVAELLRPFELDGGALVVAVSARTETLDGTPNHAAMWIDWRDGRAAQRWANPVPPCTPAPESLDAYPRVDVFQGGAAMIRRDAWERAGGLDEDFSPGYWEDYDLAARLAEAGGPGAIVYSPWARAFHQGKASMAAKYTPGGVRDMMEAHRLLWELRHRRRGVGAAWALAGGVARDLAREWWRGGPFHLTRGVVTLLRRRRLPSDRFDATRASRPR